MARSKASTTKKAVRAPAARTFEALGPGLHAGYVEMVSDRAYRVRLVSGERGTASLADEVEPALAEECLRSGRMVILCETALGPTIVGALQTARSVVREADGALSLSARTIRLRADEALVVEAGPVAMRLDKSGSMRAEGEKMVIDMSSNVRVLSALVELP